jgi:hypothetical protein
MLATRHRSPARTTLPAICHLPLTPSKSALYIEQRRSHLHYRQSRGRVYRSLPRAQGGKQKGVGGLRPMRHAGLRRKKNSLSEESRTSVLWPVRALWQLSQLTPAPRRPGLTAWRQPDGSTGAGFAAPRPAAPAPPGLALADKTCKLAARSAAHAATCGPHGTRHAIALPRGHGRKKKIAIAIVQALHTAIRFI